MTTIYPEDYETVFRDHYQAIKDLPVLDLKGRQGHTDYIDFLTPKDMTKPVMRFVDKFNRPGIAIHLRCKHGAWADEEIVLALFQRYTGEPSKWTYGWGNSRHFLEHAYNDHHEPDHKNECSIMACDDCPIVGSRIKTRLLESILNGTDKVSCLATERKRY